MAEKKITVDVSHEVFKDRKSKDFFDRQFPLKSAEETQIKLRTELVEQVFAWNESLNVDSDFVPPSDFTVTWIGVNNWDELKNQSTCQNCSAEVKYGESNCQSCLTAKPHFILTIKETESTRQLLNSPIVNQSSIPTILPEGCAYDIIGVSNQTELNKFRNCVYCGAPVLFTFPACTHCGMSKPYVRLTNTDDQNSSAPTWKVGDLKTTVSQGDMPGYFEDGEVSVSSGCTAGICKATKVTVSENASIVAANAIEVTLKTNSKAHEIAARYVTIHANSTVHSVTVYDSGTLILDESSNIDELFLGEGVKIEVRGMPELRLLQKILNVFRTRKKGVRSDVACALPRGMEKRLQAGQ